MKQKPSASSLCLPHRVVAAATDESYTGSAVWSHKSAETINGTWWQRGPPAFMWTQGLGARAVGSGDCLESFVVKCLPFLYMDRLSHHTAHQREGHARSTVQWWACHPRVSSVCARWVIEEKVTLVTVCGPGTPCHNASCCSPGHLVNHERASISGNKDVVQGRACRFQSKIVLLTAIVRLAGNDLGYSGWIFS